MTGCPRRFLFRSVSIFAIEARAVTVTIRPGTAVVAVVSTDLFLASLGEFIVALILVTLIIIAWAIWQSKRTATIDESAAAETTRAAVPIGK